MLKDFFGRAWSDLKTIYNEGLICSERHMQCELFKLLKEQPESKEQYKIFEPRLTDDKLKSVIPDFLITSQNENKVVAAVELKYVPHSYSTHTEDLNTLIGFYNVFQKHPDYKFPHLTDPKTGLWRGEKFRFDKNLTLIFCDHQN